MTTSNRTYLYLPALLALAVPAAAQQDTARQVVVASRDATTADTARPAAAKDTMAKDTTAAPKAKSVISVLRPIEIQHVRPQDQRGLNVFEPPKDDAVSYEGFKLSWGAAFTQQFQDLKHSNTAAAKSATGTDGKPYNANQLMEIGAGFNNAVANLNLNAQLAKGIRVAMTSYLSARHHNESWVKDGYLLIDESPIDVAALNKLMKHVSIKAGHFEINYGDAHFRRTDNGNALFNPFVGNYLMDAFTTEIGGEVYVRANGLLAMGSVTSGEVKGMVQRPNDRGLAYIGKLGVDRQLRPNLRTRLTGSIYTTGKSASNTLYSGDRAGSRYYDVLENASSTESGQAWSGNVRPGFANRVTALQLNPFVKLGGLEVFGVIERAKGRASTEAADRVWRQYAGDVVYRFFGDKLYAGGRYNSASGALAGIVNDVGARRVQLGGGWFLTPNILLKGEYVTQKYTDFPTTDIRNGGKFNGFMVEGAVSF